ncbi:MAG: hypothetical protein H0X68_07790 [Chloroflexi bacterium]|nr:hypothetical protein [Chloroflexota bacterium]
MGLILDLAVVALALVVIGSLALLAWTLAVSAVRATRLGRSRVATLRHTLTDAEARFGITFAQTSTVLVTLIRRTAPIRPMPPTPPPSAGDSPDA